jgi:hypothetical protein
MYNIEIIVLTCDKYIDTRVKSIQNSYGIGINIKFLTDSSNYKDNSIIGYDTPKTYDGIQDKYYNFFKNYDFSNYDYYFFVDDDTFVNKKNLQSLNLPPSEEKFCICRICKLNEDATDYHGNYTGYPLYKISGKNSYLPLDYPSGGSGFIISKTVCIEIQNYLKNNDYNLIEKSGHSDVTIGFWMRSVGVKIIPSDEFWWEKPENLVNQKYHIFDSNTEKKAITFHYVNEFQMKEYDKRYNQV